MYFCHNLLLFVQMNNAFCLLNTGIATEEFNAVRRNATHRV